MLIANANGVAKTRLTRQDILKNRKPFNHKIKLYRKSLKYLSWSQYIATATSVHTDPSQVKVWPSQIYAVYLYTWLLLNFDTRWHHHVTLTNTSHDTTGFSSCVTAFWKVQVLSAIEVPQALTAFGEEQVLNLLRLFIWRQIAQNRQQLESTSMSAWFHVRICNFSMKYVRSGTQTLQKNLVADDVLFIMSKWMSHTPLVRLHFLQNTTSHK